MNDIQELERIKGVLSKKKSEKDKLEGQLSLLTESLKKLGHNVKTANARLTELSEILDSCEEELEENINSFKETYGELLE